MAEQHVFEDVFEAVSKWAESLPEFTEKVLTEEESRLIIAFKKSVKRDKPFIYSEDLAESQSLGDV